MVACPFCGAPESDRFDLEGRRFLVFPCQFTPEVDPRRSDEELSATLGREFGPQGTGYFRAMCDRLHRHVTTGAAARLLGARDEATNRTDA